MDSEYILDESMVGYSLAEDANFYRAPTAFRFYAASIDKSHFITSAQFRAVVPVKKKHELLVEGFQQEDHRAKRFYVNLGYQYALSTRHAVGGTVSGGAFKPDIDLAFFYQYGSRITGIARFEFRMLDVANNLIFNELGVDPVLEDTTRSYAPAPRLYSVQFVTPEWKNIKAEFVAGFQTEAGATVESQSIPNQRFSWNDSAAYLGALFQWFVSPAVAIGTTYRRTFDEIMRGSLPGSIFTSDYRSTQRDQSISFFALAARGTWQVEAWMTLRTRSDKQKGTDYDQARIAENLDYLRDEGLLQLKLSRVPLFEGIRGGLLFNGFRLNENEDAQIIDGFRRFKHRDREQRLSLFVGYQFNPNAYFVFGTSFDLDGDDIDQRFDGGYLRLVVFP